MQTACMSAGQYSGATTDDGMEVLIIGTLDGVSVTADQYIAIQSIAMYWKDTADIQMSTVEESAGAGCAGYGAAYAVGGASQGLVYAGADAGAGALVSGVTGCMGGFVNGYVSFSNARSAVIGNGTIDTIRLLVARGDRLLANIVVVTSFVRSRNRTNAPAPGTVPDWGGAPVP